MKKVYDIIIAGGGPAGLCAAVDLSKKYKVLLLEKRKPGETFATWYSYMDRVKKNHLEEAIEFETPHIKFKAPTTTHFMKDDCVVLNHDKVMNIWLERAISQGVEIKQAEFIEYQLDSTQQIEVLTSVGHYSGRLLIDAMGIGSKIVQKNKLIRRSDAWVIYGAKISQFNSDAELNLEYYPLNDENNTYVGVHPYNATEMNFYVFKGVKNSTGNPDELVDTFEKTLKETHPSAKKHEILKGTIVSGTLKTYAYDRVVLFGSSGMLNPDGCGMGFNEILLKHEIFSVGIDKLLTANKLDKQSLNKVVKSLKDRETLSFQRIIGAFSLYFIKSPGKWDGGVKWLNAMGSQSKYWMRNEMTMDWIMTANIRLNKVISIRETYKMIPFNDFFFILKNLIRFSFRAVRYKLNMRIKNFKSFL